MNELYRNRVISKVKSVLSESLVVNNYNNQALKGRAREIFISELLKPFLNPTIGICTGIVIDSDNNQSKQIDIILYDKNILPPSMLTEDEGIIPYESALVIIEVKSKLNRDEVQKSVQNARSIKLLQPFFVEIKRSGESKGSPACFIFAFDSDLKNKSEYERLQQIVDEENEKNKNLLRSSSILNLFTFLPDSFTMDIS